MQNDRFGKASSISSDLTLAKSMSRNRIYFQAASITLGFYEHYMGRFTMERRRYCPNRLGLSVGQHNGLYVGRGKSTDRQV